MSAVSRKLKRLIAREVSSFSRYYNECYQILRREEDAGELLEEIQCAKKEALDSISDLPNLKIPRRSTVLLLNAVVNFHSDLEGLLKELYLHLDRFSRVALIAYSPYLRFLISFATKLGMRSGEIPRTFLTRTDLANICKLSSFEVVRLRAVGSPLALVPWIGRFLDGMIKSLPLLKHICLVNVILLRPIIPEQEPPSLSVVVPARNEKGNIENVMRNLRKWKLSPLQIVFVEGHSTDGTWEEIKRIYEIYSGSMNLQIAQQKGKGKADAVRLGFELCTNDVVTVLDADLTMPPELLIRFYEAYCRGLADFINGSRLVYSMESEAMRFANRLGNVFFAKALSYVLDTRIGDSLCGTKLLSRMDSLRFSDWRRDFGDFDPFGDFELLFPAAVLGLGIVDVPIQYRSRSYGSSNIHPVRDGLLLLKMTLTGFFRIKSR